MLLPTSGHEEEQGFMVRNSHLLKAVLVGNLQAHAHSLAQYRRSAEHVTPTNS